MSATTSDSVFIDHHNSVQQQQPTTSNNHSRESTAFPHSAFGSSFSRHSKKPRISKQDLLNKFNLWQSSSLGESLPEGFAVWSTVTSQTILPPVNTTDLFKWDSNTRINPDPVPKPKSTTLSSERGISGGSRGRGRGRGGGGLGRLNTHHNPRPDMLTSPSTPPMQPLWAQDDDSSMHNNHSAFSNDALNTFDTFGGGDAKNEGFSLESMAANTQRMTDSWKSAFSHRPHHQHQNETPSSVLSSPALEDNSWRKKTPLRDEEPQTLKMPENIDFDSLWLYSTPDKSYQGPFTLEKLRDWANNGYFSADIVCVQPYTPSDNEQHKKKKGYLVLKHVIEAAEEYERKRSVEDVLLDDDDHVQGVVGVIMDEHHHHLPHAVGLPHTHRAHPHGLPSHAHPGNMIPTRAAFGPHVRPGPHIPQQQPQQIPPRGSAPHQQFPHVGPHGWNPHMIPPHQYEMMLRMQQHQNQQSPQFMPPQAVMQQAWGFNTGVPTPLPEDIMSAEKIENELKYALTMQRQVFLQQQQLQHQHQQHILSQQEQHQQQYQSAVPVQSQAQQPEQKTETTVDQEPIETVNEEVEVIDVAKPEPTKHGYVLDDDTFVPPSSASLVIEPTPLMMNDEPEQKDKTLKKKKKKKSKAKAETELLVNPLPHQPSDEQFEEYHQQQEAIYQEEEEITEPVAVKPKQPKPQTEITIISTPATWGSATEPSVTMSTIDVLKEESKQKRKQEKEKKKNAALNKVTVESQEAWPKAYAMPAQSILDIQQEQTARREQDKTEQQRTKVLVPGSGQNVSIWGMGALTGAAPAPQEDAKKKKKAKKEKKKKTQQGAEDDNEDNGHQDDDDMFWNYEEEKEHKPASTASSVTATTSTASFSSRDFPAPKASTAAAAAATSAKKEKKAATTAKKSAKPAANFSYASILSSPSSRPATTIASAVSAPTTSSRVIDNSQFPSLSKKAPAPTTPSVQQSVSSTSSNFVNDFPLPIKKAQSKNASKKASKKK